MLASRPQAPPGRFLFSLLAEYLQQMETAGEKERSEDELNLFSIRSSPSHSRASPRGASSCRPQERGRGGQRPRARTRGTGWTPAASRSFAGSAPRALVSRG